MHLIFKSIKPPQRTMGICLLLLVMFMLITAKTEAGLSGMQILSQGNSLAVEKENALLVSPNRTFSAGFYQVGNNAYCFAIWFANSVDKTVVWMANRDTPVNGKQSKLTLQAIGNLVLTDADGSIVWSTNSFAGIDMKVKLLESGNLVLTNQVGQIIWQSFNFPTDTILPHQPLTKNTTLVSMRCQGTYFSGYYNFRFDDNNILDLIYNDPLISSVYWPGLNLPVFSYGRTPYNSSRVAVLDEFGQFVSSDLLFFNASDYGIGPKRRITLDYDGLLRMYSLQESTGLWDVSWLPGGLNACQVHGLCGINGVCIYNPQPTCTCPKGFVRLDPSDWFKGCSMSLNMTCDPADLGFMELQQVDYDGYDLASYPANVTFEVCRNLCLNDCRCKGFGYLLDGTGQCVLKNNLLNGYRTPTNPMIMHVKVAKGLLSLLGEDDHVQLEATGLNCSTAEVVFKNNNANIENNNEDWYMKYLISFVASFAIIETICVSLGWWYFFSKHTQEELVNMGYIALAVGFKRFSYAELKRATKNFKDEIGRGGFGTVYKGVLGDGRVAAVKRLDRILQGDSEFWAEVSVIGRFNHMNVVKLWGFCAENEHKLLVYEYMDNGSLDEILFLDSSRTLSWGQRYNIAVGTAKGLSYLHEECLEWVLHCDVKPQNILLDDDFEAKVADFGLSKLFIKNIDIGFSRVCGTRGYLAPEWMMNMKIDTKADVYSYGIVLLELLSGRSASSFCAISGDNSKCNHLVDWVVQKVKKEGLEEVLDPRLNDYNKEKLERLLKVALLCVAEDRNRRPAMSQVVKLLIGYDEMNPEEDISN